MINRWKRLATIAMLTATLTVTACRATTPVEPQADAALLSAQEATGGQQTPLGPDSWASSTPCGPDLASLLHLDSFSNPSYSANMVRYAQGDSAVILALESARNNRTQKLADSMQSQYENACTDEAKFLPRVGDDVTANWRMQPLRGFDSSDVFAFQAVFWRLKPTVFPGKSPLPSEPVASNDIEVSSTARAYGRICDTVVMVRINNTTATPPTEAELKELWDKQVNKLIQVRYPNYPKSCA